MRLLHIHLPCRAPSLYPPYTIASRIQERLRRRQLDFKDATAIPLRVVKGGNIDNNDHHQPPTGVIEPPPPTLLSFTPLPTYTLGRRQTAPLSDVEVARLRAPLRMWSSSTTTDNNHPPLPVTILPSPRGGLTTYHGPGQAVLWPVLDLRSPHHKQFTVRCYSRLLEDTTIATLASRHLRAFTTDDPGVWVHSPSSSLVSAAVPPSKIAALGVHLRRHVSALGTAINVDMPGPEEPSEEVNPWARIVACGLEGKTVTSLGREARLARCRGSGGNGGEVINGGGGGGRVLGEEEEDVAAGWAEELAGRIGVDGVETMRGEDVIELMLGTITHEGGEGEGGDDEVRVLEEAYLEGMRRELGR